MVSIGSYAVLHILSYVFSLYALLKSKHRSDKQYTYGYSRFETLAAFSNCIFMVISSFFILLQSFHFHEDGDDNGNEEKNDQQKDNNSGDSSSQNSHSDHHEEHGSSILYLQYGLLIYNLVGVFSFAEYALFVPSGDIAKEYNISGVSHHNYESFKRIYKQFYQHIRENFSHFIYPNHHSQHHIHDEFHSLHDDNHEQYQFSQLQQNSVIDKDLHLTYSSHYENMHSIFLHFLIDVLFVLGKIFTFHLRFINFIGVLVAICIFAVTIMITKRLLVTTSRLLLHALPIQDNKTVTEFLNAVNKMDGVLDIKEKYFWGITTGYLVCNIKLLISKTADQDKIQREINFLVNNKFQDVSVQMEREF